MQVIVWSGSRPFRCAVRLKEGVTFAEYKKKVPDAVEISQARWNKKPSTNTMSKWMMDGVAKAVDGCRVEPDGTCPHGYPSWLLALGVI